MEKNGFCGFELESPMGLSGKQRLTLGKLLSKVLKAMSDSYWQKVQSLMQNISKKINSKHTNDIVQLLRNFRHT